jgi:hypothetical protein
MRNQKKWLAAMFLFGISQLHAQTTGELHGLVQDASQKSLPGAKVTARMDAGSVRSVTSDAEGHFAFTSIPVGQYTVQVEAAGFKSHVQEYVDVTLGHVVDLAIQLEPGDATKVLALETPLVERSSSQIGAVVNASTIVGLPLDTRDTYQLLQLQPGVESQQGYDLFAGSENPGVVSVNGGRGRANNFNVNGGDANDLFVGIPAVQPSPDTIEEFRVLTNGFDAEYGRNSGSIVNVVTKSGTNEFHGNAFEFLRNRVMNTRGFFDSEAPKFNQNQFGGTFGGPLRKDRTYVFLSAEARQLRQGISSDLVTVPTAAERGGDFSMSSPFSGTLHDGFLAGVLARRTGCAQAVAARGGAPIQAGVAWAAIFPGNRIPSPCFDATAADLLQQFVPLPNSGANTYQAAPARRENAVQPTARIDQAVNASNLLTFYYYFDDGSVQQPFSTFEGEGANLPGFGAVYDTRVQQFNLANTTSIGSSIVNQARFSYFREGQSAYNHPQSTKLVQNSCATVPADSCFSTPANPALGITPGLPATHEGLPSIAVNGLFSIGNNAQGELPQVGNTFNWSDTIGVVHRAHSLKFGIDVRRQRFDQTLFYNTNGSFQFTSGGANGVGATNLVPDFLLGLPTAFQQGSSQTENIRSTALALFAQDEWNIRRNLTLNVGLRWELTTPMSDVRNRIQTFRPGEVTKTFPCRLDSNDSLAATFGSTDCNPGSPGESVFPVGLVVPGDSGIPGGLTSTYFKAFAPRVGLAWSPSGGPGWLRKLHGGPGKTSIRAAWGLFYNPIEQLVLEQFNAEPPFGGSISLQNPIFNTPFQAQNGDITANPFHGVLNPSPGQPVDWSVFRPIELFGQFQPNLRVQYSVNYHFTVQRQLGKDMLVQIGYVGSQGHRLLATHDLNYGQAQPCLDLDRLSRITGDSNLACGPFSADAAYSIAARELPAGFTLHLPYGPVSQVTGPNPNPIYMVGLRRYSSPLCNPLTGSGCSPDGTPVFGSIFSEDTVANSNYNSLQVAVEKRAFAGLQFQAAYTWSKSIDNASSFENLLNPLDYASDRSLSLFDARHRLVFSYFWDLPRVLIGGPLKSLLNGWSLSGILTLQSGFPVPITSSDDQELMSSFFFTTPGEPDRIAPLQRLNPRDPLHLAFDPASFAQPELGQIGNSPRSVCCGPGINNIDVSLMKGYAIREHITLQFRGEFFNMPNHAQFSKVDGNISDGDPASGGTFGKVLRARDPRLVQFAMKLLF